MLIEEIAKLAGVSIATVSKIVNGKDQSISAKTRKRVLDLVKEYNYTPYGSVLKNQKNRQFLIAYLCDESRTSDAFVNGLLKAGQSRNYNFLLCNSFGDPEEELKNISRLIRDRVDAIVWRPLTNESRKKQEYFDRASIPVYCMSTPNSQTENDFNMDYATLAYTATEALINKSHKKIACIASEFDLMTENAFSGFKRCMFDYQLALSHEQTIQEIEPALLFEQNTAYICLDIRAAERLYDLAEQYNVRIPQDVSLVAIQENSDASPVQAFISTMVVPWIEYGEFVANRIIDELEHLAPKQFEVKASLSNQNSIAKPRHTHVGRILTVGSLNMDITINTRVPLKTGVTTVADVWNHAPGGKGLNQSIAVAKMGGRISLIGKIGKDYDGSLLFKACTDNHVDTRGISTVNHASTGKAYVAVQQDGESSIAIYAGANAYLKPQDIDSYTYLFNDTDYCLIPLEIPQEAALHAAHMARKLGVKVVMKPTNTFDISDEMLSLVDILVPNRKEAEVLCGDKLSIEEQATELLARGVKVVIITMGSKGCYLCTADLKMHFKALDVTPIDTTGGADAFIGALVTFLAEGEELVHAVERANYAAGLSVMSLGVASALVNRETFELHYERGLYL